MNSNYVSLDEVEEDFDFQILITRHAILPDRLFVNFATHFSYLLCSESLARSLLR